MKYKTANELVIAEQNAKYIEDVKNLMSQSWLNHTENGFTIDLVEFLEEIDLEKLDHVIALVRKKRLNTK